MPAEATGTIDANLEAYRVTHDRKWLDRAYKCLNWFLGDNDLRQTLYDHTTGGCCDALLPQGVDENQGALASVSWLLSLLSLYEFNLSEEHANPPRPRPGRTPAPPPRPASPTPTPSPRSKKNLQPMRPGAGKS